MYISPNMYDFLGETFHMTFYPLWNIKEDILTSLEKEVFFYTMEVNDYFGHH